MAYAFRLSQQDQSRTQVFHAPTSVGAWKTCVRASLNCFVPGLILHRECSNHGQQQQQQPSAAKSLLLTTNSATVSSHSLKFWYVSSSCWTFWATVCKTVCPMLSDRCLSVCPVCDVGLLWPKGWMDQHETWHAGRPRLWPHWVRWGPSTPSPIRGQSPQFSAHVYCAQSAAWSRCHLVRW